MPFPSRDHELPWSPYIFLQRTFAASQDGPTPSTCGRCRACTCYTPKQRAMPWDPLLGTPCVRRLPILPCSTNGNGPYIYIWRYRLRQRHSLRPSNPGNPRSICQGNQSCPSLSFKFSLRPFRVMMLWKATQQMSR